SAKSVLPYLTSGVNLFFELLSKKLSFVFASLIENEQAVLVRPVWAAPLQRETFYANLPSPSTCF
ncbi:hypothetical protein, partial [Halodesulfovibrio aestuarii]|uniref:hypothetical protein n=1 Tax=Halodesulfovibrio aestuarii TaxID=126333 RepID=UPI001C611C4E